MTAGRDDLAILVSLRSDADTKPGGDASLLRTWAADLGVRHRVETVVGVPSTAQLAGADLVLAANLDRPIEPAAVLAGAVDAGVPMVLYTLHHPAAGVEAYLRHGADGVRGLLGAMAGRSPIRYEQLLWTLHAGADLVRERRLPAFGSVRAAQRRLLAGAHLVVSSQAEAEAITTDIGPIGGDGPGYRVLPHPLEAPPGPRRPVAGRVIVPGRIESRKNQMSALALAERFAHLDFLFVGGVNPADGRYGRRFVERVAATANAEHVEHLPTDEFYPLLLSAEAVLSASWFEVTSLIELFCVANGIPLAASTHSYLTGGGPIHRFDPGDLDAAAAALSAALTSAAPGSGGGSADPGAGLTAASPPSIVDLVDELTIGAAS